MIKKRPWLFAVSFVLVLYTILIFLIACEGSIRYAEIDSNALALISLQYRFSTICSMEDIIQARIDFPRLYAGVYSYDTLRSAKLIFLSENAWMPYYFPIWPFLCIPMKILLTIFGRNQERAFGLTNAVLLCSALWWIVLKLKATDKQKFYVCLLLICSPLVFYINYINYECFVASFLILSVVQYLNQHKKSSAILLSLAGMANQTVMAVGIVMIIFYLCGIVFEEIKKDGRFQVRRFFVTNAKETVLYACCFLLCFIPNIWRIGYQGADLFLNSSQSGGMLERAVAYFFDLNLGVASFALLQIAAFVIMVSIIMIKREWKELFLPLAFVATVFAYSLMSHICCGMEYCSRYVVWSYPLVAIFLGIYLSKYIYRKSLLAVVFCGMSALSAFQICFNCINWDYREYRCFNPVSKAVMNYLPELYNPLESIFYSRGNQIDDGSQYRSEEWEPTYYSDTTVHRYQEIRKIMFRSTAGDIDQILGDLTGTAKAMEWLEKKLYSYPLDGKIRYISINPLAKEQVKLATPEEKGLVKESVICYSNSDFGLEGTDAFYTFYAPITIKENTVYKIELEINPSSGLNHKLWFDFYGENYDFGEQELHAFLIPEISEYTFYIDSGDFTEDGLDVRQGYFRLIYPDVIVDNLQPIKKLTITEMERTENVTK